MILLDFRGNMQGVMGKENYTPNLRPEAENT